MALLNNHSHCDDQRCTTYAGKKVSLHNPRFSWSKRPTFLTSHKVTVKLGKQIPDATYEGVSKSFWTESITKYTLTTINTRWEATQRVMAAKVTRLTHKIAIQMYLVTESCTICSFRSRRPVRKLLNTLSYEACFPSSVSMNIYGEVISNYKFIIIQLGGQFLCIISSSIHSSNVKYVSRHNFKNTHRRHIWR
jgi:hypothetical protein